MGKAKNNQGKSFFSFKNDEIELVEICQFLRDTTEYKVEREWYILFDKMTGDYIGYTKNVPNNIKYKVRNPDIILINKETGKLVMVIEIDGDVHYDKFSDTEQRNEEYFYAGIPILPITKLEIDTTIFDYITRMINKRLGV